MNNRQSANNYPSHFYPFEDELVYEKFDKSLIQPPNNFSSDYFTLVPDSQSIKEELSSSLNRKAKHIKFPESFVCSLWIDQMFKSKYLFTTDHKRIEVIYPGRWNFEKGPDFKNARIRMERGEIAKGDVEIHNFSSEWESHGHYLNAEYNNVILHVYLWNNKVQVAQRKANGFPLLQIKLTPFLTKDVMELYSVLKLEEYHFPSVSYQSHCAEFLKSADKKRVIRFLDIAGEARLLLKADRFLKKMRIGNYNQLLYEGIMESLGFKNSKFQFTHIANTATLYYLKGKIKPIPQQEKNKHIEAILFGIAGFLDCKIEEHIGLSRESKPYFNQLRNIWLLYEKDFITKKLHISRWSLSGVRPANYPYRRLAGMSYFLSQNLNKNLISKIYPLISIWTENRSDKEKIGYLLKLFPESEDSFWSNHYSPAGKTLSSPRRMIGKDRISDMVINVFLPTLLSFAKLHKAPSMEKIIYQVYNHFPRLSSNRIIKFMEEFILGLIDNKKDILNKAKRQQALHQIYLDYCESNKDDCHNCKFYFIAKYLIQGESNYLAADKHRVVKPQPK